MPELDEKTKKRMADFKKSKKIYDIEFDKLKAEIGDADQQELYDRMFRGLYHRVRAGSDATKKLHLVTKRIHDEELDEIWSDLADAINNAWAGIQAKPGILKSHTNRTDVRRPVKG